MRARRGYGREVGCGDKGYTPLQTNALVGTCEDMCPPRERQWREKERLLHPFEVLQGTENDVRPKADRNKTVKQFSRSAAGHRQASPDELRPSHVLLKTTEYLMRTIAPSCSDDNWADTYHFIWDRMWSVRQDMTIQDLNGSDCTGILEHAVRFYIYAAFRCFEEDINAFDPHINSQHLQECLKRLLVQYQHCALDQCVNRPEMEAIYILHNLGSFEALAHAMALPKEVRSHSLVKVSVDTSLAHRQGNFFRVLRNYRSLPFLLACTLHPHLELIRRHHLSHLPSGAIIRSKAVKNQTLVGTCTCKPIFEPLCKEAKKKKSVQKRRALQVMAVAFSSQNCKFPLSVLARWLCCTDIDAKELCLFYQLQVQNSEVKFLKGSGNFTLTQCRKRRDPALVKTLFATDVGFLLCADTKRQLNQAR